MISEETIDLYKLKNKQVAAQIMSFDSLSERMPLWSESRYRWIKIHLTSFSLAEPNTQGIY